MRYCRERWFQEVAACIDSDPGRAFSPGELAKRCGMSRQSFYSKFKQATGMAPLEYIRRKRLREAELLLSADIPSSDVGRINSAAAGESVTVSGLTMTLLLKAREVASL